MMSLPAMTNQSASHRGIANQIDTTTRFCNAQVIKTCRAPDRCVTGRLGHDAWARARQLNAVVWTELPPKFGGKNGTLPTEDDVINHLQDLTGSKRDEAERYVRLALSK